MTATLTVEGKDFGRNKHTTSKQIPFPTDQVDRDGNITMRDLLIHVVTNEVAAFEQRQQERRLFRVLTATQIADGAAVGKIDPAAHEPQSAELSQAIATALQAFEDGLVFAFIDKAQKESLDEIVTISPDSSVAFVRLMPLAGG